MNKDVEKDKTDEKAEDEYGDEKYVDDYGGYYDEQVPPDEESSDGGDSKEKALTSDESKNLAKDLAERLIEINKAV
jgi:hypothetical protein